jgi:hypothetical protein
MSASHGLSTEAEIRKSIVSNLPVAFGETTAVDGAQVIGKFNELLDYASAVSAPFLGPDTIRYQTILLSLSLFLIAASAFHFTVVKLFDVNVPVGPKFFVLYSALIAAVAAIFVIKAFVDHQRTQFVRAKNANVRSEVKSLIVLSLNLRHIQEYFWLEIFDAVGRAYNFYSNFAARVVGSGSSLTDDSSMQVVVLDRDGLEKEPRTKIELERLDRYLQLFGTALERDKAQFRKEAEVIVEAWKKQDRTDPTVILHDRSYDRMEEAYGRSLKKWVDVRNELVDRKLDALARTGRASPELVQAEALGTVLKKIVRIRNVYAICEITAPVIFAAAAVLLVALR